LRSWLGDDEKIWARYLIAIETAEKVARSFCGSSTERFCYGCHDVPVLNKEDLNALCQYLPHLIVSGCKSSITDMRSTTISCIRMLVGLFGKTFGEWSIPDHSLQSRIAFLTAWGVLHHSQGSDDYNFAMLCEYLDALEEDLGTEYYCALKIPDTPLQQQAFSAVVVAGFAMQLREENLYSHDRFILPLSDSLPVVDLGVAPPAPFFDSSIDADRSWGFWLFRHNAVACQARNIEGEWMGSYRGPPRDRFDVLVNIQLQVLSPTDCGGKSGRAADDMVIAATDCYDEAGRFRFSLHGSINEKTGQFDIVMEIEDGSAEGGHWRGAMTPFGLVGQSVLGQAHPDDWIWLYKKSWCKLSTERYRDLPVSEVDALSFSVTGHPSVTRGRPWLL